MGSPSGEGQVYILHADNGLYKIGMVSVSLDHRIKILRQCSPCKLELICSVAVAGTQELEKKLHKQFAPKRSHGEWFRLDEEDIAEIKQLFDAWAKARPPVPKVSIAQRQRRQWARVALHKRLKDTFEGAL